MKPGKRCLPPVLRYRGIPGYRGFPRYPGNEPGPGPGTTPVILANPGPGPGENPDPGRSLRSGVFLIKMGDR